MGDSWEDEEFDVPAFVAPVVKGGWEDEDEVVEEVVAKPTAAQIEAAAKKVRDEEIAFAAKVAKLNIEKETPAQKKLRERLQAEEADSELAAVAKAHNDKYGGSDEVDKYDHYNDMEDDF
eukprot:gene32127-39681_t